MIGLNNKQIRYLPTNIIGINRTEDVQELVKWYSAAEVYLNTSIEETFGMTIAESISCKTPVIVFNKTALPEIAKNNGLIIDKIKINNIIKSLNIEKQSFILDNSKFTLNNFVSNYFNLYKMIEEIKR